MPPAVERKATPTITTGLTRPCNGKPAPQFLACFGIVSGYEAAAFHTVGATVLQARPVRTLPPTTIGPDEWRASSSICVSQTTAPVRASRAMRKPRLGLRKKSYRHRSRCSEGPDFSRNGRHLPGGVAVSPNQITRRGVHRLDDTPRMGNVHHAIIHKWDELYRSGVQRSRHTNCRFRTLSRLIWSSGLYAHPS